MSHSNAIDTILDWSGAALRNPHSMTKAQAKQALYEAVAGCVPEEKPLYRLNKEGYEYKNMTDAGLNKCRNEVLTNLKELFGVDDQGNDLQPSDPEADWQANSEAYNRAGISKEGEDHE